MTEACTKDRRDQVLEGGRSSRNVVELPRKLSAKFCLGSELFGYRKRYRTVPAGCKSNSPYLLSLSTCRTRLILLHRDDRKMKGIELGWRGLCPQMAICEHWFRALAAQAARSRPAEEALLHPLLATLRGTFGQTNKKPYIYYKGPAPHSSLWTGGRVLSKSQELKQLSMHSHCGLPWWLSGKESAYGVGDLGSVPGLGRSLGGGHDNPLQYSGLENPHGQRSLAG